MREERRGGAGGSGAGVSGRGPGYDPAQMGSIDPFFMRSRSAKQTKINFLGDVKARTIKLGRAIAKFMHYNRIPPNVANTPYYKPMIETIQEVGPGIKPPTAHEISGKYLDMEVEDYKRYTEAHRKTWVEYGCTLMCDGWTGPTKKQIVNFMVYCVTGTIFHKSVDTGKNRKNARYLYGLMDEIVEELGEDVVVQVVTDNEACYKLAGNMLETKRKNLVWVPCAAHCIDLILEDIEKISEVKWAVAEGKKITNFIYNHNMLVALMREFTKGHELLRPGITRFATEFVSLESLCRYKAELMQMFTSSDWVNSSMAKDRNNALAREVPKIVLTEDFWLVAEKIVYLIEPLIKVLKLVDGDRKPTMGYVYDAMDRAKLALKQCNKNRKLGSYYKKFWQIIDSRWNGQLHQAIHAARSVFKGIRGLRPGVRRYKNALGPMSEALLVFGPYAPKYSNESYPF